MIQSLSLSLCAFVMSVALWAVEQPAESDAPPVAKSKSVVWAGLDYSMVRMYGTMDFREPEQIIPQAFDSWNGLFLTELVFHESKRLQKAVGKPVISDAGGMAERNKLAKTDQVIRQDGMLTAETHITDEDLARAVREYTLTNTSGLGLVFIVDRLVKVEQKGAVYIVFFDVGTREVITKQRVIVRAAGFGFRNYWFRVVKDALRELKRPR